MSSPKEFTRFLRKYGRVAVVVAVQVPTRAAPGAVAAGTRRDGLTSLQAKQLSARLVPGALAAVMEAPVGQVHSGLF